jgi:hypothetical protein
MRIIGLEQGIRKQETEYSRQNLGLKRISRGRREVKNPFITKTRKGESTKKKK